MKDRLILIIFIISLFLVSCVPGKEISFEVLQASEFEFPEKTDSLLVLNLAYYPWVDTLSFNILNKVDRPEQYIIDTLIISSIFNGFFSIVDQSEIQELTNNQYFEIRGETKENFLEPLSIKSVNYLCEEFKTNQIVALEYYGMDFSYDYFGYLDGYYASLDFERMLGWRIYKQNEGMIYEDIKKDTLSWQDYIPNSDQAHSNLPSLISAIKEAFWYGGETFAKKISPYWQLEYRYYFSLNKFKNESLSLDKEYLTLISQVDKKNLAFKAYYNLAVENERNGNLEEAIIALEKAMELKPKNKMLKSYTLKLEEGVKRKEKVLKQID